MQWQYETRREGWQQGTAVHRSKFIDKPFRNKDSMASGPGRASIHQGTSATCGCSFLVPNPVLQLLLL